MAAAFNCSPEFTAWVEQHPIRPGPHSGAARAALERRTIHIPDVWSDPNYTYGARDVEAIGQFSGCRYSRAMTFRRYYDFSPGGQAFTDK